MLYLDLRIGPVIAISELYSFDALGGQFRIDSFF